MEFGHLKDNGKLTQIGIPRSTVSLGGYLNGLNSTRVREIGRRNAEVPARETQLASQACSTKGVVIDKPAVSFEKDRANWE